MTYNSEIETSRKKLLGALEGTSDITLIRNHGNIGDHLIHAGTRRLLAGVAYREVSLRSLDGVRGQLGVITGGGAWCHAHSHLAKFLPRIERRFERVVIFPSSFDVTEKSVRRVLSQTNALAFARERISYEQVRDLCQADLAHDCALFFDYTPYQQGASHEELLTAYRTDSEAVGRAIPQNNNDISLTCGSLDEFLWTIARHQFIETDRAHVMIAAALFGKRVYYNTSNYHKVPALVEFNLPGYPLIRLGEGRAAISKEQFLSYVREGDSHSLPNFFGSHRKSQLNAALLPSSEYLWQRAFKQVQNVGSRCRRALTKLNHYLKND